MQVKSTISDKFDVFVTVLYREKYWQLWRMIKWQLYNNIIEDISYQPFYIIRRNCADLLFAHSRNTKNMIRIKALSTCMYNGSLLNAPSML